MEEIEDELNESKKSGDLSLHFDGVKCEKDISEGKDSQGKDFVTHSFHTSSNEDAGFVDDPVNQRGKELVSECNEECNEKIIDCNDCNVETTMETNVETTMETLPTENYLQNKLMQENESHSSDIDGIEGLGNKSVDSLLYHSADSAQFHSADDEQLDVELKENGNDIFNLGVQITINDKFVTHEEFVKDVSTSSETSNNENNIKNNEQSNDVMLNGNVSDPAVTITTVCETDKIRKISELASEESDAVVMRTFMISSDEYDATITTMLEISPTPMEPVDTPHDENSIVKTFEISSSKYNATITTTVEDVTDTDGDFTQGKTIEIVPQISDSVDDANDSHDEEIKFQIAHCQHDIPADMGKNMGVISIETDEDYLKTSLDTDIITASPGSVSSIKKSYEELSYNPNVINPADSALIDKFSDEHDITIQNANETSCEPDITDSFKLPCPTDPDTTFEDIDIAVSDIEVSDIEVTTDITHVPVLKVPNALSVNDDPSIFTSSPGTVCELRKSYEDLVSVTNGDGTETNENIDGRFQLPIDIPVTKADLIIHDVNGISSELDSDTHESDKPPLEICNLSSYESYDNVTGKEGDSSDVTTDVTIVHSTDTPFETPTMSSQVSSADSDHAIEETSSFETDMGVQNVYSVLTEPDDFGCHVDTGKPADQAENVIEILSSSDGDGTTDILCDVSPDGSSESVDPALEEPRYDEIQKPGIEVSTQVSVASGSNRSYDVLSIDSDMEISHKFVSDYEKEPDSRHVEVCDVNDNSTDDIPNTVIVKDSGDISIVKEADGCMHKINDFSENEADVIIEKTFEDLSTEVVRNVMKSSVPTSDTYDVVSIDSKLPDQLEVTVNGGLHDSSGESMRKISDFSEHEADTIMHKTYEDLSSEAANVIPIAPVSAMESDVTEKAYDILSIDAKIPDKFYATTDDVVAKNISDMSLEENIPNGTTENAIVSEEPIEILSEVTVESVPNTINFTEDESSLDKPFEEISTDTTKDTINKDLVSSRESIPATEITYHILSFDNGPSNEADISTVVSVVDKQVPSTDETFEHLIDDHNHKNNHANNEIMMSKESDDYTHVRDSSSDLANISIDKTETLMSDEVNLSVSNEINLSVSEVSVLPNEKAYDVYSFGDSTPTQSAALYEVSPPIDAKVTDDPFEHLICENDEVDINTPEIDSVVDINAVVDEPTPTTLHTESESSTDKTYQIVSFENPSCVEDNVTTIDMLPDTSPADKHETFEHVSNNDYVIQENNNDGQTDNSSEVSHDISTNTTKESPPDDIDEFIDIVNNVETGDVNINVDVDESAGIDSHGDRYIDNIVDPDVPTLAEIADIYDATKVHMSNDDLKMFVIDQSIKCQRESSVFEVIEGGDADIQNNDSIDIDVKENKTPPMVIDINNTMEKDDTINIEHSGLKTEPVTTISIEKTSSNSVETTGQNTADSNGCSEEEVSTRDEVISPEKPKVIEKPQLKTSNGKKMHPTSLDEYDVIEHDEINSVVIPDYDSNRKFSFAVLSYKIKQAFSPTEAKSKPDVFTTPVSNRKPRVSVHVEETSSGEKIQVLTFSRNAVRYDGRSPSIQNGDTDADLDDDAFVDKGDSPDNAEKIDRSSIMPGGGGVKKRIAMMEGDETISAAYGGKKMLPKKVTEPIVPLGVVGQNVVIATPSELRLTSQKLTLNKDALITDRYPPVLPDYPSDRRSLIALEIYTTERSFVRGLEIAAKVFKPKIESSGLLDSNEMYSIFSNIEEILLLNIDLLQKLFERIATWSDEKCIGDVFLPFKDDFSIYAKYSINYDKGQEIILQKQKRRDFEAVLKECYANPKCMAGQTLAAYLITVIQRLPRYILLLRDLNKRTPDSHPDSKNLQDAQAMMEEKAGYINEQLKKAQCMQALEALETQITGLKQYYIPERTFVYEGPVCLLAAQKTYQGVLFNDIFVFAYKGEKLQSEVELVLELKTVWVEDLGMLDPQTTKCDAIGVYTPDRPYRMYVSSVGEKKIWLQHLKATITAILENDKDMYSSHQRKGRHNYKNGTVYEGSFLSTKRHGYGKLTIPSVMTYEGEWEDDEKNGSGIAKYYTGEVFDGYWTDDKPDGSGTFRYATGDEISCEWTDGVKNGPCVITYKNGDKFTGQCVDDQIQGHGTLVCKNGYKYVGEWWKNMKHGKGQLQTPDGLRYNGDFARDRFHGNGELMYPDGSYYKGEFEHGLRFGDGTFNDKGGCCSYEGKWVDDKKNGRGKMIFNYGDVYEGTWVMDKRHGKGKMSYAHGGFYDGYWDADLMHGKGKLDLKNGSHYDGEFVAGQMSGYGSMKYPDGGRYVGDWKFDLPDGKGIWTKPGGWVCDGTWANGRQNGSCSLKDPENDYEYEGDWLNGIKEGVGTDISQGFTYSGSFLEDMYHGPGLETGPEGSKYDGKWYRGLKHGKGTLTHVNKLTEHQTWKHGCLVESPLIYLPRERTPIQRWHHT